MFINAKDLMDWLKLCNLEDKGLNMITLHDGRVEAFTSKLLDNKDYLEYRIVFNAKSGMKEFSEVRYSRYVYDDVEDLEYYEEPYDITEAEANDLCDKFYKKVS